MFLKLRKDTIMKCIALVLCLIFTVPVYCAEIYSKASDTVLTITETKEVTTTDNTTLSDLKKRRAELVKNKDEYVATRNAEIALIDQRITEAVKLGIEEITDTEDIVK